MSAALHALSVAPSPAALRAAARGARVAFTRAILLARNGRPGTAAAAHRLAAQAYRAYLELVVDGASDAETEALEQLHSDCDDALKTLVSDAAADDGLGVVLIASEDIEAYITSGRAGRVVSGRPYAAGTGPAVTLTSVKSGAHYSYRVRRAGPLHAIWHVERRAQGDDAWAYIGGLYRDAISLDGREAGTTYRFVARDSHPSARVFDWFVGAVLAPRVDLGLDAKLNVWTASTCGRCSRPLTDDHSIARGLGPVCVQHVH